MKLKTTQKRVKEVYRHVIRISYCGLWYLLHYKEPFAYTCGKNGWNADIYDIGEGVAICTGYRTFGNMRADYDLQKEYNDKAQQIVLSKDKYEHDEKLKLLDDLLKEFIEKVLGI